MINVTIDLKKTCLQAIEIVKHAASFIQLHVGKVSALAIEEKASNSLVSYVDKEAEKILVSGLSRILPGSVFLTEEATVEQKKGDWLWIIDPLDGTTNFLHGVPYFAVSVALQHLEETVIGIVFEIGRKECFYAWKEGGAYLNQEPIKVSQTKSLRNALIATGFPHRNFEYMEHYLHVFDVLLRNTRGIRRPGSAATDLVYTACGRFDAYFERSLNSWDVAAGAFIVQEAGGLVCDFSGKDNYLEGGDIIAVNPFIQSDFLNIISEGFKLKNATISENLTK